MNISANSTARYGTAIASASPYPNEFLTNQRQSPLCTKFSMDKNKERTYKNVSETQETAMLTFFKDFAAFVTLGAFTVGSLTWMDVLTRLV
jgi:hypothetical protein